MENTNNITDLKAECSMVLTMTPMEVEAVELALILGRSELRRCTAAGIKEFAKWVPGSEEQDKEYAVLLRYLIYQDIVDGALDCIADFQKRHEEVREI